LLGEPFERKELESILSPRVVEALTNLGLASPDTADESRIICPFVLYPIGEVLTVSDRWLTPEGKEVDAPADFVYPAMTPNTMEFMGGLPSTPCDTFLELCSGAGTVALTASRYARHAWALDITERSTQAAEFNRLLNGFDNVTTMQADCYEGLENLQFDRIVAHPPYMPVVQPAQIFYDGGQDGEQVTRRIVQGLSDYLKPGGCFYCLAQGSDRKGAPLEQRLRGWLGEAHADFDVAVVERRAHRPEDAAMIYAMKSKGGYPALNLMRDGLSNLGIESLSYGWMIIQRKHDTRKVFTVRRSSGPRAGREEIAWLLKWETFAAGPSAFKDLLDMVPIARRSLELHTLHRLKEGELVPEHLAVHTEEPFAMNCNVDPWMVYLIPLCDGQSTVRQLWETCKAHNFIHPETPPEEFAKLIGVWISGGFLEVVDYRPPHPPATDQPAASTQDHLQNQIL
jgi:SAM-dependent methyltransferase